MYMEFDFIVIEPFLPFHCDFFSAFGCKVSFSVGFSVSWPMVVQHLVVILMFL